jgi:hypothetical protein
MDTGKASEEEESINSLASIRNTRTKERTTWKTPPLLLTPHPSD